MNTSSKSTNPKEQVRATENVPGTRLREYLIKRNMVFEEKRTGKSTTITIKNRYNN